MIVIALLTILVFLPRFFNKPKQSIDKQAFLQELAQLKISVDSSTKGYKSYGKNDDDFDYTQPKRNAFDKAEKGELFAFDPNTLDAGGWKRLGVRDKTVETILHFLEKGYKFRQPGDIKKIYGLKPEQADRLIPYIHIAAPAEAERTPVEAKPVYVNLYVSKKSATIVLDVNEADTAQWTMLKGIGNATAARIVAFRNKLGGFTSVSQLKETYGLPDSTFQNISSQLRCKQPVLQTININTADARLLKAHPYMNWNIANAIVRYREQHGNYKTVMDLMKIDIISQEFFDRINAYLSI